MQKKLTAAVLASVLLLTGCGSFLNREYSSSEPHSDAYFGGDDRSALRLDSYQDLVNGLLTLITDRAADGTIWLYPSGSLPGAAEAMDRACAEIQQETPLGAYAVDYITYTIDDSAHNYSVVKLTIGYRRSAEQVGAMVHVTSVSALYDLLTAAASSQLPELVIQASYFDQRPDEIRATVEQVQRETLPDGISWADVSPWQVNFYPDDGQAGIVEILLGTEET